jgi:hypothetical protein
MFYLKIKDKYAQLDDRQELFISEDKVGTPLTFQTKNLAYLYAINNLPNVPIRHIRYEDTDTPFVTLYHRAFFLDAKVYVECVDGSFKDVNLTNVDIDAKVYDSPPNTRAVNIFPRVVL